MISHYSRSFPRNTTYITVYKCVCVCFLSRLKIQEEWQTDGRMDGRTYIRIICVCMYIIRMYVSTDG